MTMRELSNYHEGYLEEQDEAWDRTREICYVTALAYVKNPKTFKRTDIFGLAKDKTKKKATDQSNKHELYNLMEKWDK